MESSDGEEWRKEEDEDGERYPREKGSSDSPNFQSWSCSECQMSYTDKESYITHMAKQHRKVSGLFKIHTGSRPISLMACAMPCILRGDANSCQDKFAYLVAVCCTLWSLGAKAVPLQPVWRLLLFFLEFEAPLPGQTQRHEEVPVLPVSTRHQVSLSVQSG